MTWPTQAEVDEALLAITLGLTGAAKLSEQEQRRVLSVIRRAATPRPVWPAKEAAACLGTVPANLQPDRIKGIGECVACVFPRPTVDHPDRVERLFWRDLVEELARVRAAREHERGGA